jgi:hypothetical protein
MACKTCDGEGVIKSFENQSPLGSGCVWLEEVTEDCADCLRIGICCNCDQPWTNEVFEQYLEWIGHGTEIQFFCPWCGYTFTGEEQC